MQKITYTALFFVLLFLTFFSFSAKPPKSINGKTKGVRVSIGPALGFYSINTNHAKSPSLRASALFSFRKEIRFGRDYKTFFLYGVDYFFHGLTFQSYYFKPDSLKLYDKKFDYKYSLFIHEINVPLQVKYSFNRENNNLYSAYLMFGYHLRYLLPGNLNVTQNGNEIKTDNLDLKFKTPFISDQLNSFLSITFGSQRNNTVAGKRNFFAELSYRYSFSPYYFEKNYSASSLYMNSSHLVLLVGIKF